jgi:biotin carboxyl carrier protein
MIYDITINGKTQRLELKRADHGVWACRLDDQQIEVDAVLVQPNLLSLRINDKAYEITCERVANELRVWVGSVCFAADVRDPRSLRSRVRAADDHGLRKLTAPMPGKVVRILGREGEPVDSGAGILIVEAMKMQNEIKAPKKGRIQKILVKEGAPVNAGDVLAIVE